MTDIIFTDGKISATELSLQLEQKNEQDTTVLQTYGGYVLVLAGAFCAYDNEQHQSLSLEDFIARCGDKGIDRNVALAWLDDSSTCDLNSDEWVDIWGNPWLEWIGSDGDTIGDIFDIFYQDPNKNIELLVETLEFSE